MHIPTNEALDAFLEAVEAARKASAQRLDVAAILVAIGLHEKAAECTEREKGKQALVALYS